MAVTMAIMRAVLISALCLALHCSLISAVEDHTDPFLHPSVETRNSTLIFVAKDVVFSASNAEEVSIFELKNKTERLQTLLNTSNAALRSQVDNAISTQQSANVELGNQINDVAASLESGIDAATQSVQAELMDSDQSLESSLQHLSTVVENEITDSLTVSTLLSTSVEKLVIVDEHTSQVHELQSKTSELSVAATTLFSALSSAQTTINALSSALASTQTELTAAISCNVLNEKYDPMSRTCSPYDTTGRIGVTTIATCDMTTFGKTTMVDGKLLFCDGEQLREILLTPAISPYRTCKEILNAGRNGASGVYNINFNGANLPVYCDFDSYGGGWTLLYSTLDDSTGDNNFQAGTVKTATINTITPTTASKRVAWDLLQSLSSSFNQVMLSGFQRASDTGSVSSSKFISMYFNRQRVLTTGHTDFYAFIAWGIGNNVNSGCNGNSFYGRELSTNQIITLTWENYAWVAGAGELGCAWGREVWNEIDTQGGHILAPSNWGSAEPYSSQNDNAGATRNAGIHHLWIR
eukprot:m.183436 g.183436  ORF g.183436 m.183436 type:complete len:525 (-) comp16651_c1_seq7:2078-3652(-)